MEAWVDKNKREPLVIVCSRLNSLSSEENQGLVTLITDHFKLDLTVPSAVSAEPSFSLGIFGATCPECFRLKVLGGTARQAHNIKY